MQCRAGTQPSLGLTDGASNVNLVTTTYHNSEDLDVGEKMYTSFRLSTVRQGDAYIHLVLCYNGKVGHDNVKVTDVAELNIMAIYPPSSTGFP
jgi:hypothetical protein